MTAKQFYNFHRSQFDTWEHGEIKKAWIDENGNTCIMYQSGKWCHYNVDKKGTIIFWWLKNIAIKDIIKKIKERSKGGHYEKNYWFIKWDYGVRI